MSIELLVTGPNCKPVLPALALPFECFENATHQIVENLTNHFGGRPDVTPFPVSNIAVRWSHANMYPHHKSQRRKVISMRPSPRLILIAIVTCILMNLGLAGHAAAQRTPSVRLAPVDLELAFVIDASGSIDDAEMTLQRQGYMDALSHPRIQNAIKGGFLRAIAVAYIEFAGDGCTQLTVGWTRINDGLSAEGFGRRILASERNFCFGGNAVSEALAFAAASIETNKFEGTRRVIDLSGDGPNTMGEPVELIRDAIVKQRIVINALAIDRPSMPDLPEYFKRSVTGGPGSFVIKAKNRKNFAEAILKKLIREIADRSPWPEKRRAGLVR